MRKVVFVSWMMFVCFLISGCVVAIGNKPAKSPDGCIKDPHVRATIAEIDAVNNLMNEASKYDIYMAIAKRPGLSPHARIHLTKAASTHLMNEASKYDVLLALANNVPKVSKTPPPEKTIEPIQTNP